MRVEVLGFFGTPDRLLRSRVTTLTKTCRSERKAEDNQQVVTDADQLLAPSLSALSSRFTTICHNYYYVLMTVGASPPIFDQSPASPRFKSFTVRVLPLGALLVRPDLSDGHSQ
jgi:hypothetical protein